ncbi:RCC1 domain-containing protein [Clostridioides difficile]
MKKNKLLQRGALFGNKDIRIDEFNKNFDTFNVKDIFTDMDSASVFIIKDDLKLYGAGYNTYGNLGIGNTTSPIRHFSKINIDNVKYVSSGASHSLLLTNDGTVYSTGQNTDGALGLGDYVNRDIFTKVNIDNVKQIACGNGFSMLVTNDNELYVCGNNQSGRIGLGSTSTVNTFTKIDNLSVKEVFAGVSCSYILTINNEAYSTGSNYYGQLGLNDTANRNTFTKVNIDNVIKISTAQGAVNFLLENGDVYGCGENSNGQVGAGGNSIAKVLTKLSISNVKNIESGRYHKFYITNNNDIYVTGINAEGALGDKINCDTPTYSPRKSSISIKNISKIKCAYAVSFILTSNNELYMTGYNTYSFSYLKRYDKCIFGFEKMEDFDIEECNHIESIDNRLLINKNDERVLDIGLENNFVNISFVRANATSTFIVVNGNEVYAAGYNTYGNLGLGHNRHCYEFTRVPLDLKEGVAIKEIYSNKSSTITFILLSDNTLYSTGYNLNGALGLGDNVNRNTFTKVNISSVDKISVGDDHVLLKTTTNELFSTGSNYYGQLGLNDTANRNTFTKASSVSYATQIVAYENSSYYIDNNKVSYSVGCNNQGQLSINNTTSQRNFFKMQYITNKTNTTTSEVSNIAEIIPFKDGCLIRNTSNNYFISGGHNYYTTSIKNSITDNDYSRFGEFVSSKSQNVNMAAMVIDEPKLSKVLVSDYNLCLLIDYSDGGYKEIKFTGRPSTFGASSQDKNLGLRSFIYSSAPYYNHYLGTSNFIYTKDKTRLGSKFEIIGKNEGGQRGDASYYSNTQKYTLSNAFYAYGSQIIYAGKSRIVIRDYFGNVYCSGVNSYGCFGIKKPYDVRHEGFVNISKQFSKKYIISNIKEIKSDRQALYILLDNGEGYVCGNNASNKLGTIKARSEFIKVPIDNIKEFIPSDDYLFILTNNNQVYSIGANDTGQLGLGDNINRNVFTKVPIDNVKKIITYYKASYILTYDNELFSTGLNGFGQLGLGDTAKRNSFTKINVSGTIKDIWCGQHVFLILLEKEGIISLMGCGHEDYLGLNGNSHFNSLTKINIEGLADPSNVSILMLEKGKTVIAMKNNIFVTGANTNGALGVNTSYNNSSGYIEGYKSISFNSDIKEVALGEYTIFILLENGDLYSGGNADDGIGFDESGAVASKKLTSNVKHIYANGKNGYYIDNNNDLYAVGSKQLGQVGNYADVVQKTFVRSCLNVKQVYTQYNGFIVQYTNNKLEGKGNAVVGQVGIFNGHEENQIINTSSYTPSDLSFSNEMSIIRNNYGLLVNNKIFLHNDDSLNYRIPFGTNAGNYSTSLPFDNVRKMSLSSTHSILILENGDVYGCGSNQFGELAINKSELTTTSEFIKINLTNIIDVACGDNFTYFLKNDGTLFSVGKNSEYQLGIGHNDEVNELQEILTISNVKKIYAYSNYVLAITTEGQLYVQGYNINGILGLNESAKNTIIKLFTKVLENVKDIKSYDDRHIFVIKNDKTLYVTGVNKEAYKIEDVEIGSMLYTFSQIYIPRDVNDIVDALIKDETLYIISKVDSEKTCLDIKNKSYSSIEIDLQNPNNELNKVEMFINNVSSSIIEDLSTGTVTFEINPENLSLGENKILFKAHSDIGNNLYINVYIYKKETGATIVKDSTILINGNTYNVSSIVDNTQDVVLTLDKGLLEDLNSNNPIYHLINKLKVQLKLNESDTFKDMVKVETRKTEDGYKEIYELKDMNIQSAQPKVIVEEGNTNTTIKKPSMLFNLDVEAL